MNSTQAVEWIESLIQTMYHETTVGPFPDPEYVDEIYEALDLAIATLKQRSVQESAWVPVSEELPQDGERLIDDDVLVFCEDGQVRIGFCMGADLNGNREWCMIGEYSRVIAWMPLPEPYERESEDK